MAKLADYNADLAFARCGTDEAISPECVGGTVGGVGGCVTGGIAGAHFGPLGSIAGAITAGLKGFNGGQTAGRSIHNYCQKHVCAEEEPHKK